MTWRNCVSFPLALKTRTLVIWAPCGEALSPKFVCLTQGVQSNIIVTVILCAQTIADIYKSRWQVELFFKWIKQNLKLKGFLGTSRNAVLTQIWVALCVCLLIAFIKFSSGVQLTIQQIARLLQLNLFLRRDLLELLTGETGPPPEPPSQMALAL